MAAPLVGVIMYLADAQGAPTAAELWGHSVGVRQLGLLARSLIFSGVVAASATVLGAALVAVLLQRRIGQRLLALVLVPLVVVPPSIHGLNWTLVFMAFNEWLISIGLSGARLEGWIAAAMIEVLAFLPLASAVAWAALVSLDESLLDAAVLVRSARAVITGIVVPLVAPMLWTGAGVIFLLSLSDYSVPSLCAVNVYALEIYAVFSSGVHPAAAVLTALPLVAVAAAVVVAGVATGRRAQAMAAVRRSGRSLWEVGAVQPSVAIAFLLAYAAIPVALMIIRVGRIDVLIAATAAARAELLATVAISLAVAVLCTALGLLVGRALESSGPSARAWWILTGIAFAVPAPLVGIGVLRVGGLLGTAGEELWPVWANTARFLPIAAFASYALFRRLDERLLDAARVFGKSRTHALCRVQLPLMLPGLVVSAVTCFAFAAGELGATLLVASPGHATLMMRMFNLLHYGASRDVAALCLILLCPVFVAGLLLRAIIQRQSPNLGGGAVRA